jgi:putative serine/threonine protein kinase
LPATAFPEVPVEDLEARPFQTILCYPRPSDEEANRRTRELATLSVEALIFSGPTQIGGLSVLGKGHVGVVVRCVWRGRRAAVKIRRVDADRADLKAEGEVLSRANAVGVGPTLLASSPNFIVMEEVRGRPLLDWLEKMDEVDAEHFRKALRTICEQARMLDVGGIDHRELSDPRRHVVVKGSGEVHLLDFETAGLGDRKRNVNSVLQYLTMAKPYGAKVLAKLGAEEAEVLSALKAYRASPTDVSYEALLKALGLS